MLKKSTFLNQFWGTSSTVGEKKNCINLLRNFSLILGEKKRGKDFRLFFKIFLRSQTVLGNLTEKKSIDLSANL